MSDAPTAISAVVEPLILAFSAIARLPWSGFASLLAKVVLVPARLLLIALLAPLRLALSVVLAISSPVIYVFGFGIACVQALLGFAASLEPLYTFFGTAALVGIIAGLVLSFFSSAVTYRLGMHDAPGKDVQLRRSTASSRKSRRRGRGRRQNDSNDEDDADSYSNSSSSLSTPEVDWYWPEGHSSSPTSPTRRRPAKGLLSQVILEEDDDEF